MAKYSRKDIRSEKMDETESDAYVQGGQGGILSKTSSSVYHGVQVHRI